MMNDYVHELMTRYEAHWRALRGTSPQTALRSNMDEELLIPGSDTPGYSCWRALPFDSEQAQIADWAQARAIALDPRIVAFYTSMRRYEILFSFNGRLFSTDSLTKTAPPLRAIAEDYFAWENAPDYPFAISVAYTCDDKEPQILLAEADTAKIRLRKLSTNATLLKLATRLDAFCDQLTLEVRA